MGDQVEVKTAQSALSGGPDRLADFGYDLGAARPYHTAEDEEIVAVNGQNVRRANQGYVTVNVNGQEKTFRVNDSTLRKDEWEDLDDALSRVRRRRLNGIADLRSMGLTRQLGGLGSLIATREEASNPGQAQQTMDGVSEGESTRQGFNLIGTPVPITFQDFNFSRRHLDASRTRGDSIDTSSTEEATRNVADKLEDTLFNGSNIQARNYSIEGYTTASNRLTGTLTAAWTDDANRDILGDINENSNSMLSALYADNAEGPFMAYIPQDWWGSVQDDYKAESERTYADRIRDYEDIEDIKPTGVLSDEVVLVQMTSDVVQLQEAEPMTTVEWEEQGGMVLNFRVMAASVPLINATDSEGNAAIAHYTV